MDDRQEPRLTYEGMAAYWPTPAAAQDDPRTAARMNGLPKIVVSGTLDKADWANTRLVNTPEELAALKRQPGGDMAILGSSNLTVSLLQMGLLDEMRIMVNPVILSAGKSVFRTTSERLTVNLVKSSLFQSGNVLLYYRPAAR